jgi:hypothetical protein
VLLLVLIAQSWSAYLDSSLVYIGLTKHDIRLRTDYTIRDEYRLKQVDKLLSNPLGTVEFVVDMNVLFQEAPENKTIKELISLYDFDVRTKKNSFIKALTKSFQSLTSALADTSPGLGATFEELTRYSPDLTMSIEQERADERQYDSLVTYLKENAKTIDYSELFQAGELLLEAAQGYEAWLKKIPRQSQNVPGVSGNILYCMEYEFGEVIVGDTGKNIYTKDFAVIIDLGGDDIYQCGRQTSMLHLIVDRAGEDVYEAEDYALACGYFGVSILLDEQGDDVYRAENYSLGCGVFGLGWLIDQAGSDMYFGDTFTQGAGGFGLGILSDNEGNDLYQGALYAQGFASTYGIGILADDTGNDQYIILEKYTDEIRYLDHYLSLSQGFSIGFRPDLSGGIGLLLEGEGNDYYLSDIFAQGAAYWYGIGAIVDNAGNDAYVSYQYGQGSGVHIAIGALVDKAGDDNYVSKGVSQGCGHDLAFGVLYDISGDDSYVAFDLSQGAGNANGIGLLVDESGDDAYAVKREQNTQGYGDFRREYGSVGLLIDIRGKDTHYSGKDATLWKKGKYGLGIDWE